MKNSNNDQEKIKARPLLAMISTYILALGTGWLFLLFFIVKGQIRFLFIGMFFVALVISLLTAYKTFKETTKAAKHIKKLIRDGEYYTSVLDILPFPVHTTDNNMKWTFMNRAFEKLLIDNKKIKDRESAYGMDCCNAGANICNTPNCGIKQLKRGVGESYFDWNGGKCKQDTTAIIDKDGNQLGYVEVVTDLTELINENERNKKTVTVLTSNLTKIADGNLDLDFDGLDDDGKSDTKAIVDSFTKVKNSLELLTSDAEMLSDAAINGRLEVRVDASRHNGEYRSVIDGMNKTLEAIVGPLDVASGYIHKMANGERLEPVDNIYKGYYATLIDNLNSAGESIMYLLSESAKLARAGQSGDLAVRGDVGALKGGFAEIIKGINDMLQSITQPIDEAIRVIVKMTKNDFTDRIENKYAGMPGVLTDSINEVRNSFLSVEDFLVRTSKGDLSRLDEFLKNPKKSENDKLRPASIAMMQSVRDIVSEANNLADSAANGELSVRGDSSRFEGTYRLAIDGINRMIEAVEEPINESIRVLEKWAAGDLSANMTGSFDGDYARIANSMNTTAHSFRSLLSSINEAATQVASGSQEIASGSQNLSQGATEQASSLQELTASISEVASQTKQNAKNAENAKSLSKDVHDEALSGNEKMKQMQRAINDISESSANIAKIIKVIDDIAFQTNILALNAAVEAARAGQYGKGFAVVAEEVRNLAAKSAGAAKNTTELIENAISKVNAGTKIADDTAAALDKIVKSVEKSSLLVSEISSASINQATGISQIDKGLEQVSTVVQTNSATAEESAAASTELSGQAESLKTMVSQFKLGGSAGGTRIVKEEKKRPESPKMTAAAPKASDTINLDSAESKYGL